MVGQALILLLVLVLLASALLSRRWPLRQVLGYTAAWIAVFAIGWLIAARFT